ncbi:hypothetical protein VTH06DRAFT_7336 [Thermothelomyces fergusii]
MGPWTPGDYDDDDDDNDDGLIDLDDALRPLPTVNGSGTGHDRIVAGSFPTVDDDNLVPDWDGVWGRQSEPDEGRGDTEMEDVSTGLAADAP